MNKDFRVSVSITSHPKIKKLMRRCGDIAFYNLVCFWAFVAQNKPTGDITGLDADDIEIASGWNGQCSMFFQALLDLRFIDVCDGKMLVHDWEDHNGFACHAQDRSVKAKKAAEMRWNRKIDAPSMPEQCSKHDQALLPDAPSNAPSPTPSPSPNPTPNVGKKHSSPRPAVAATACDPTFEEQKSELLGRYSPEQRCLVEEALKAVASTRATGKMAEGITLGILRKWDEATVDEVVGGITIYLDRRCHLDGKRENYLWGIIRNTEAQPRARPPGNGKKSEITPDGSMSIAAFNTLKAGEEWINEG